MTKASVIYLSALLCGAIWTPASHAVTPGSRGLYDTTLPTITTTVERGGVVHVLNREKGTVTVDGVTYNFSPATIVHPSPRSGASVFSVMPAGSKIKFRTTRATSTATESVTEVWVLK